MSKTTGVRPPSQLGIMASMSPKVIPVILAIVLALAVVVAITYVVMRYLRGSITIDTPITTYRRGQNIEGNLTLLAKKPIEGEKLLVSLVGNEVSTVRTDDSTRRVEREIYREDCVLEQAQNYAAGATMAYMFCLNYPSANPAEEAESLLAKMGSVASKLMSAGARVEWRIEGRLHAKGVDLYKKYTIDIDAAA